MRLLRTVIVRFQYELFALAGVIVVLWQMLLPGYVLTLDLVFGPHLGSLVPEGFFNGLPVTLFEHALAVVMPVWMIEKVLLMALVFGLFYVPLRFFPLDIEPRAARYVGAMLFAVNPFVYERFLAGHWLVLAGYVALVPFVYFLVRLVREPSRRTAIALGLALAVVGVFSMHYVTMAVLVSTVVLGIRAGVLVACEWNVLSSVRLCEEQSETERRSNLGGRVNAFVRASFISLIACVVATSYWTLPLLFGGSHSPVGSFGPAHWEAFMTDDDPFVGTLGNVALLYGFWAERYYHLEQFVTPAQYPLIALAGLCGLVVLVGVGVVTLLRNPVQRVYALGGLGLAVIAVMFSAGIATSPVQGLNVWLFEHVGFWSGFRDTQKWSAFVVIVYAVCVTAGTAVLLRMMRERAWAQRSVLVAALCVPILYTPTMAFGLMGQVQPVWYPASWHEANAAMTASAQHNCKAIFLPWHQYYTLSFNNDLLTAHLASKFFDCQIVTPQNTELGDISSRGVFGQSYDAVELAVEDNDPTRVNATVEVLKAAGIEFVIVTDDIADEDPFQYPFLGSAELTLVYEGHDEAGRVSVFQIASPKQFVMDGGQRVHE